MVTDIREQKQRQTSRKPFKNTRRPVRQHQRTTQTEQVDSAVLGPDIMTDSGEEEQRQTSRKLFDKTRRLLTILHPLFSIGYGPAVTYLFYIL